MSRHFSFVVIIFFASMFISIASGPAEDPDTGEKYEKMLQACNHALQIDPDDADAWLNKGIILKKMGKYSEGAGCIEKAINLYICR